MLKNLLLHLLVLSLLSGQDLDPTWKFSFEKPTDGWTQSHFDDSSWKSGKGGFGEPSTPGSRVATFWKSSDIWLRRTITLAEIPPSPTPAFPFHFGGEGRFDNFVKVVGEFGGHGFPVDGHLWNPEARNWGYGGLPRDKAEWIERYRESISKLAALKEKGIAAGIYTQTTDVEGEINGLITYDRRVQKLKAETLREIHREAGIIEDRPEAESKD